MIYYKPLLSRNGLVDREISQHVTKLAENRVSDKRVSEPARALV
jgi:hypothetical protein